MYFTVTHTEPVLNSHTRNHMRTKAFCLSGLLPWLFALSVSGEPIFLKPPEREIFINRLTTKLNTLSRQPVSFPRDTAIFFTLETLYYQKVQRGLAPAAEARLAILTTDSLTRLARRHSWKEGMSISLNWQASVALNIHHRPDDAYPLRMKAVQQFRQLHMQHRLGLALIELAVDLVYVKANTRTEWNKAMQDMQTALAIGEQTHDPELIHQVYNYLGDFHIHKGQYGKALFYYRKQAALYKHYGDGPHLRYMEGRRTNLAYLGICNLHLGHENEARAYFEAFLKRTHPDQGTYAQYLLHVVLYESGQYFLRNKKDFTKALQYQSLYSRILPHRPLFDAVAHHETMSRIYEGLGNYQQALIHSRQYQQLKDSLSRDNLSQKFTEIETKMRVQEKDLKLKAFRARQLRTENEVRERTFLFLLITLALVILLLSLLLHTNRLKKKSLLIEWQLSNERTERNLRIMSAQETERQRLAADLHDDVGVSLASLRRYLTTHSEAQHTLDKIISDIRTISHNLMPVEFHDLGLVDALDEVSRRLADNSGIRFHFLQSGTLVRLSSGNELIIYRLVQELMYNIVRHSRATEAFVQLVYHDTYLNIAVEDNGVGFETETAMVKSGIGLKNVSLRTQWLGGKFSVDTSPAGTTVFVDIPYAVHPDEEHAPYPRSDR